MQFPQYRGTEELEGVGDTIDTELCHITGRKNVSEEEVAEDGEEPSTEEPRTISTKAAGLFGTVLADESHKLKSVFTW